MLFEFKFFFLSLVGVLLINLTRDSDELFECAIH